MQAYLGVPYNANHCDRDPSQLFGRHLIPEEKAASSQDDDRLHVPHHIVGE